MTIPSWWTEARLGEIIEVDPKKVRFSQSSISRRFVDGHEVDDVIEKIIRGDVSPWDLPPISVHHWRGQCWTHDNRRLYCFKVLKHLKCIDTIYARSSIWSGEMVTKVFTKLSTQNEGMWVKAEWSKYQHLQLSE